MPRKPASPLSDSTPYPGTRVPPAKTREILANFHRAFRPHTSDKIARTWNLGKFTLLTKGPIGSVDVDFLNGLIRYIGEDHPFYFFVESGSTLHRASLAQIKSYFASRHPWEDHDLYLFEADMQACSGFTHQTPAGIAILTAESSAPQKKPRLIQK